MKIRIDQPFVSVLTIDLETLNWFYEQEEAPDHLALYLFYQRATMQQGKLIEITPQDIKTTFGWSKRKWKAVHSFLEENGLASLKSKSLARAIKKIKPNSNPNITPSKKEKVSRRLDTKKKEHSPPSLSPFSSLFNDIKIKSPYTELIPKPFQTEEFISTWRDWIVDRRAKKNPVTEIGAKRAFTKLLKLTKDPKIAESIVDQSIRCGWSGFFKLPSDHELESSPQLDELEVQLIDCWSSSKYQDGGKVSDWEISQLRSIVKEMEDLYETYPIDELPKKMKREVGSFDRFLRMFLAYVSDKISSQTHVYSMKVDGTGSIYNKFLLHFRRDNHIDIVTGSYV